MTYLRALVLLPLAAALSIPAAAAERQLPGRVIRVIDGDSLVLDVNGSQYRIDLAGVDAPELNQPWGRTAATRLGHTLTGAFVVVRKLRDDRADRVSGTITFKGRDIAHDLLYDGLAWSTVAVDPASTQIDANRMPQIRHPYTAAEGDARAARRGLWSDPEPVPPWEWRRGPVTGTDADGPLPGQLIPAPFAVPYERGGQPAGQPAARSEPNR